MTRERLREEGEAVRQRIGHRMNPPLPSSIDKVHGMQDFTREAIFGAVWARPNLDLRHRMIATLAVLCSLHRTPHLRTYINSALNLGLEPLEIQEVLIQCSVDAGFPVTASALGIMLEVYEQRGITVPEQDWPTVSLEQQEALGQAKRAELLGPHPPPSALDAGYELAPGLREWTLRFGFGEIYRRPGLDTPSRIVCTLASQTAVGVVELLPTAVAAARNVGLSKEQIVEVLTQTAPYAGLPASLRALAVAADVLKGDSRG